MPSFTLLNNQAKVPEDSISLAGILDDLIVPSSQISDQQYGGIFSNVTIEDDADYVKVSSIVDELIGKDGVFFNITVQVPDSFTATNDGVAIAPLLIQGQNFFRFDYESFSDANDIEFQSFSNDDGDFATTIAFTVTRDLGGGSTEHIDFGQSNFTTEIFSVPDTPTVTVVEVPDTIQAESSGEIQFIGEFSIASADSSESLWLDVLGVPDGAEIYTLDENGDKQFKFQPVPTDTQGGTEPGGFTKSVNAPAAANTPQLFRIGILYDGVLPDDLNLSVRGRSIEGDAIAELGLAQATATSSVSDLSTKVIPVQQTPTQIAIAFSDDAVVGENSDSLGNLLNGVEVTGDTSGLDAIAPPKTLAELVESLGQEGLPYNLEITLPDGVLLLDDQNVEFPKSGDAYLVDDVQGAQLQLDGDADLNDVEVSVSVPGFNATFGPATGSVDVLVVADKPQLTVDVVDDLVINPDDSNPLVKVGDYEVQPGDDEEISLFVETIPPNSDLVILNDEGEVVSTFTPTDGGYKVDLTNLQGMLALQFKSPVSQLDDFSLEVSAIATEPGTQLLAKSDPFTINVDFPESGELGDESGEPSLVYSPSEGGLVFENALGSTLGHELLSSNGQLSEIGFVIGDDVSSAVIADSGKAVFSVLPDGSIIGNQERLLELQQASGTIQFFKVSGGTLDDFVDGRIGMEALDFNVQVEAAESGYSVSWLDGTAIAIGLSDQVPLPLTFFQGQHEGELFANQSDQVVQVSYNVQGWADYSNTVGLFAVVDETGGVVDPITGDVIMPGQNGYSDVALSNLLFEGEAEDSGSFAIAAGTTYMPFIVADGDISDALSGEAHVYFSSIAANSDGFDHVRLLGDNTFGFEDLHGGGDMDFNDIVIELS